MRWATAEVTEGAGVEGGEERDEDVDRCSCADEGELAEGEPVMIVVGAAQSCAWWPAVVVHGPKKS